CSRLAQVLGFDRSQLCVPVESFGFFGSTSCTSDVSRLEAAHRVREHLLAFGPQLDGERIGAGARRIVPGLDQRREGDSRYLRHLDRLPERRNRVRDFAAYAVHVAAALEIALRVSVAFDAAYERLGCK